MGEGQPKAKVNPHLFLHFSQTPPPPGVEGAAGTHSQSFTPGRRGGAAVGGGPGMYLFLGSTRGRGRSRASELTNVRAQVTGERRGRTGTKGQCFGSGCTQPSPPWPPLSRPLHCRPGPGAALSLGSPQGKRRECCLKGVQSREKGEGEKLLFKSLIYNATGLEASL